MVVAGGGAARQQQFSHGQFGGGVDMFSAQTRPDRIQELQPVKEFRLLGQSARQTLEHVVMCVDQPRQHNMVREINDAIGFQILRQRVGLAQGGDFAVPHQDPGVRQFAPAFIHGRQTANVLEEQGGHRISSLFCGQSFVIGAGRGHDSSYPWVATQPINRYRRFAVRPVSVFARSMVMVMGPTPPGTLVMWPATCRADSKSTSPT